MLKKHLPSIIIVPFQLIVLGAIIATITHLLLHRSNTLKKINVFLTDHQSLFLLGHGLFYLIFYILWPKLVKLISAHQSTQPNQQQIDKAVQIRIYLIAIFLSIELINFLR